MVVEVGRYGRLVLPKKVRDRYGVEEGTKLIVTELKDRMELLPVKTYGNPTEALYGSVHLEESLDEPKELARDYVRGKLAKELQ